MSPPETVEWSEVGETRKQLRRFLIVGSICVLVDLGVYSALTEGTGLAISASKALSYLAGIVVGFMLNKRWTFESSRRTWHEAITYFALYAATLGVNVGCNRLVLSVIGADHRTLAFLMATGLTTVLNFIGMRLVTFRHGIADRRATVIQMPANQQAAQRKAS